MSQEYIYVDIFILLALRHESAPALGSTPVGPVAGGIMGCFLVLALGLYCYRHHATRGGHVYMGSLPDHAGRCGQLDNELEEIEPQDDSGRKEVWFVRNLGLTH